MEAVILAAEVLEGGKRHGVVLVARALKVAQEAAGCDISAEASGLLLARVVRQTQVTQRPGNERWCGERLVPALVYCLKTYVRQDAGYLGWEGIAEAVVPVPKANAIVAAHEEDGDATHADKSHVLLATSTGGST